MRFLIFSAGSFDAGGFFTFSIKLPSSDSKSDPILGSGDFETTSYNEKNPNDEHTFVTCKQAVTK